MLAALIAAVLLALLPRPEASSALRSADLRVDSVTAPERAATGGRLLVPTAIENAGTRTSARSRTRYWLSRDERRGQDVRMRAVRIPRIGAGDGYDLTAKLHVPATAKPGSYHVLACADSGGAVSEQREGNNCRASADTVRIARQTQPEIPPGP
jgi:hypothetical protein